MSTTARKARKKAGVQFQHPVKTPTPLMERSWFAGEVRGPIGTKFATLMQSRSAKKIRRALEARGLN